MRDTTTAIQASVTKTADFTGASVDLGLGGFGDGGIVELLLVLTNAINTAGVGTSTINFYLEQSDDNATWTRWGDFHFVDTRTNTYEMPATNVGKQATCNVQGLTSRYVRLVFDITNVSSGTGSVTYHCYPAVKSRKGL